MEYIVITIIRMVTIKILKNFSNKLMLLILIETLLILTIINNIAIKSRRLSIMFLITIVIFMVLDSTIGLSILISRTRNSSISAKQFETI